MVRKKFYKQNNIQIVYRGYKYEIVLDENTNVVFTDNSFINQESSLEIETEEKINIKVLKDLFSQIEGVFFSNILIDGTVINVGTIAEKRFEKHYGIGGVRDILFVKMALVI